MDVVQSHIPLPHPNRPGIKLTALKAIVIHYTQNDRPSATDTMHAQYMSRPYETGKYFNKRTNVAASGAIEKGSMGKGEQGLGIAFRTASAHVFCDMDSVTEVIPLDEVSWNCGDRNYKGGYQRVASTVFKNRQNYETIGVEICNNDVIKDSDEDWNAAVENAKQWVITFLQSRGLSVDVEGSLAPQEVSEAPAEGNVLLLRHYDITGKICPKPLVENPEEWEAFVREVGNNV